MFINYNKSQRILSDVSYLIFSQIRQECKLVENILFKNKSIKRIVEKCWLEIPNHFKNVELDEYVIMPNHLHGIIIIMDNIMCQCRGWVSLPNNKGEATSPLQIRNETLGKIIGYFIYQSTK